jgi:putative endonuclease
MNLGKEYEDRADRLLRSQGLEIITRNYRCKLGEIDLVCRDDNTLVFVEVRYRSNPRFASATASVTPAKARRLWATAQLYLQQRGLTEQQPCRFDVLAFDDNRSAGEDGIQWLKNAISM